MIDWNVALSNLTPMTIVLVVASGVLLGLYFAALAKFKPAENIVAGLISFIVIGWSFYIPFFAAALVEGRPFAERIFGSMILWVLFTVATSAAYVVVSRYVGYRRALKSLHDKND